MCKTMPNGIFKYDIRNNFKTKVMKKFRHFLRYIKITIIRSC